MLDLIINLSYIVPIGFGPIGTFRLVMARMPHLLKNVTTRIPSLIHRLHGFIQCLISKLVFRYLSNSVVIYNATY